jgi:pyruvate/2-oxoglutarate/acetoin dehydrogenase E1 component/TPP-dependent pyruvate/acetoin dehydrogenase alpha subunit
MIKLREDYRKEIEALPEQRALLSLCDFLDSRVLQPEAMTSRDVRPPVPPPEGYRYTMSTEQIRRSLDAAMVTFCVHIESRIAALVGQGFYTIGPCGEEALSSAGNVFQPQDSVALHYRHLGINVARQLSKGQSIEQLLLDRARGYVASRNDPVTGGVHCSIGSAKSPDSDTIGGDYIVTSTLASQCPSAVGRALGYALVKDEVNDDSTRPVSFVTIGDGSVHNHHFWSAFHLARHARHRRIKCPVVFGISDNGLSISYSTGGYVDTLFGNDPVVPLFRANGNDMMDVYSQTCQAFKYSRQQSAPAVIIYKDLVRRFGHAASDRQNAYLDQEQIQSMQDVDVVESSMVQAVEVLSAITYPELRDRFMEIHRLTQSAFDEAAEEDKVNRQDMMERVAPAAVVIPNQSPDTDFSATLETVTGKKEVMRKQMTRVIEEVMERDDSVVYLGEDVKHGGYYVVTEGLAEKFPGRVLDFPPDETSLLGAAMGFSQLGLTPIIEIPYAKYLDCGADMFHEIAVMNWLSAGQLPNGMVVRLQGFDRGLFGGNFHTHNMLPHIPPGVDVVSFSNGHDYVCGFRHAIAQAKAGRIVVSVDCTDLLNRRHLHGKDRGWETVYPLKDEPLLGFDHVRRYGTKGSMAIVTYGNGVVTSFQARRALFETSAISSEEDVDIIDCPYLSGVPGGLRDIVGQYDGVVFADICKDGPGSNVLSSMASSLHREELLPSNWDLVAAPRTYNPLGNVSTFLNVDDIANACKKVLNRSLGQKGA